MNRRLALALSVVAALSINEGHAVADDSSADLQALISVYAVEYGLPEELLQRVIRRESDYNPVAHSRGHWGLMQIKYPTAKSMGYEGPPEGLLDAETNLTYGAKYLAGALLVAGGDLDRAMRLFTRGYYYEAKRKGLLEETGLRAHK